MPTDGRPYLISIANYTVVKNQIEMMRQFYKSKHKEYALVMIGSKKTPYYYELQKAKAKFDRQYGERSVFMFTGIDRKYFPTSWTRLLPTWFPVHMKNFLYL